MSKDPAILFYTADYLTGTRLMTYEQKGKYMDLLCLQHQQGALSEQDMLAICGEYDERIFSKFVLTEDGKYINERMEEERAKRQRYSQSRSDNGKKGGRPKKHMESICLTYEKHSENENININKDVFISESKDKDLHSSNENNKYLDRFARFWSAYPKKVGKGDAEKRFLKLKPSEELTEQMIRAVEAQKKSAQWVRDNGQYVPNPSTWLNQERWRDELPRSPYDTTEEEREVEYQRAFKALGIT